MDTTKPLQFASVLDRIKSFQQSKLAADSSSVKDPADKGTVGIPTDPENTPAKENMPVDQDNMGSNEGTKLEDKQLHPVSTGKNVPSASNGNAKENVNSPTDSLSKIAKRVASVTNKLKSAGMLNAKDEDEKKAEKPKMDKIEGEPESAENTDKGNKTKPPFGSVKGKDEKSDKTEKEAANDNVASDLSPEALMKLAATIIATEGGLEAVEPVLMKAAGVEAARQIMTQAVDSYSNFIGQQAAYEEYVKQASAVQQHEDAVFEEFFKSASEQDQQHIVKFAKVHGEALNNIENDMLKQAYMQGAQDAAAMEDAGGELPGAEGPASIEQIAQLLEAMVASGEIDEETAMGILQELASADAGAADEAEAGEAAAEGAEGEMEGEEFKQASELCAELISKVQK
ncbi:MAG: hypothetical protein ACK5DE_02360 [Bacteroidota bacterium]|jgi:hypothetical protein